jgi:hypothetical protein
MRPWQRSSRPQGQPTRGKTAANRLRRVDTFFLLYDPFLLRRQDGGFASAWFVDLGYGAEPVTTLESAARLGRVNPSLPILGVEIDPLRVAAAQPYASNRIQFRLGGFNLPLKMGIDGQREQVRAIRAFNVLRQYAESAVEQAYAELACHSLPGALLVEGTSDPAGDLWVANVLRRGERLPIWKPEGVVFSSRLRTPFVPADFQAVLPKNWIHRMVAGEPIYEFIQGWQGAARRTVAERGWGDRRWFVAAGQELHRSGWGVDPRPRWLSRGYLLVSQGMERARHGL